MSCSKCLKNVTDRQSSDFETIVIPTSVKMTLRLILGTTWLKHIRRPMLPLSQEAEPSYWAEATVRTQVSFQGSSPRRPQVSRGRDTLMVMQEQQDDARPMCFQELKGAPFSLWLTKDFVKGHMLNSISCFFSIYWDDQKLLSFNLLTLIPRWIS